MGGGFGEETPSPVLASHVGNLSHAPRAVKEALAASHQNFRGTGSEADRIQSSSSRMPGNTMGYTLDPRLEVLCLPSSHVSQPHDLSLCPTRWTMLSHWVQQTSNKVLGEQYQCM